MVQHNTKVPEAEGYDGLIIHLAVSIPMNIVALNQKQHNLQGGWRLEFNSHTQQPTKQRLVPAVMENGSDGFASATSKERIKRPDQHVLSGVR